jgi:hypothetical protein
MKTAFRVSVPNLPRAIAWRAAGLALCLTLAFSAHAQTPAAAPSSQTPSSQTPNAQAPNAQDDASQQLLRRIDQLEAKVKQLEAKESASASAPVAVSAAVATAPEPSPEVEMPTVNEVAPRLKMIVFGDLAAQKYSLAADTFVLGSFDIFMRARISDKVSALGEVLFVSQNDNSIGVDIERLLLMYRQNDYFTASFGRMHTSVGYYNTAFNYAEYLETTTDRPFIYAFDDYGGVLPMQDIGLNVTGKIPSGKLGLNYFAEVGNGRAWGPGAEATQNNQAGIESKAINGGLFIRPDRFAGLQMGFSVRYDNLTIPGPAVHETIATAHVVFINGKYEVLNEAVYVRHDEPATASTFNTAAFYTQFSRAFGAYRPYFRYQYFNAPNDDPAYIFATPSNYSPPAATSFVGRINGPSVGIRWDFTQYSALKFQYDRISLRGFDAVNGLTSQVAFTF